MWFYKRAESSYIVRNVKQQEVLMLGGSLIGAAFRNATVGLVRGIVAPALVVGLAAGLVRKANGPTPQG